MLKVNDLFCGAGGMGLGFKQAGYEIVGAWDFDKFAVESYKANVGEHVEQKDIREMIWSDLPKADVWTFGFPCQDLSYQGVRKGLFNGEKSKMFFEVMRLLEETRENKSENLPKIIMAENVTGLKKYLPVLEEEYTKQGYKLFVKLMNSKFWGLAQNRQRYFVVGVHESIEKDFVFPEEKEEITATLSSILEDQVDEKHYIDIDDPTLYGMLKDISEPNKSIVSVRQATVKGYDEAYVGDSINTALPKSKTRRGRVGKQIAQTLITTLEQVTMIPQADGSYRLRFYTPREFARLQGFPDTFKQIVSDRQFYKQMGNAVSVNVAKALAESIKEFLL